MKLETLKRHARKTATWRGHVLGRFQTYDDGKGAVAQCQHCNRWVQVLTDPAPNQIDIGGEVVAVHCPGYVQVTR